MYRKVLGDRWTKAVIPQQVTQFVSALESAETLHDIPAHLYDVRRLDTPVHQPLDFTYRQFSVEENHFFCYGLDGVEIVLDSAVNALEVRRNYSHWSSDSLDDLVIHLVRWGIPFRVIFDHSSVAPPPPPAPDYRSSPMGYRPSYHIFGDRDYRIYTHRRENFLTSSRGPVALMHGGIVNRLALEVLQPADILTHLWRLREEHESRRGIELARPLSADEIDTICGVYRRNTGVSCKSCPLQFT